MAGSLTNYSDAKKTVSEWVNGIAPKYFNFENTNNYRTGVFGYINEVMSNVTEDAFNAVSIARREFYPNHALYTNSLYRMGALQDLDAPMSIPATVKSLLIVKENDIKPLLDNGEDYIIEDSATFMVDNIPFMLDHPIVISGSKNSNRLDGAVRETYVYTIRYDNTTTNSLDQSNRAYLENRIVTSNNERLILITATLRQVTMDIVEETITKNAHIDVVTMDIPINGNLANFEVFYQEDSSTSKIQLAKVLMDSDTPTTPFCMYMLVDDNTLRLHFPANIYFTPKFNSKLSIRVYTTLGSAGNFDEYLGNISCAAISDQKTNSDVIIDGQTIGASSGGVDRSNIEKFRRDVIYAYATNETICTDNDLQKYFDKKMLDYNNKILFFKKRDDVFQRLYGAFMLLKTNDESIIPTNTLNMQLNQGILNGTAGILSPDSDFDDYYESTDRLIIKPGAVFRYADDGITDNYIIKRDSTISLNDTLSDYETVCDTMKKGLKSMYQYTPGVSVTEGIGDLYIINGKTLSGLKTDLAKYVKIRTGIEIADNFEYYCRIRVDAETGLIYMNISYFIYTNPFLISILRKPNAVGYYMNSVSARLPFDYSTIADGKNSYMQFLLNNLYVERNAILGENFYKFTAYITPSVSEKNFDSLVVSSIDPTDEANIIRAKTSGYVSIIQYENEDPSIGIQNAGVYATIMYDDSTMEKIRVSSNVIGDGIEFKYVSGHTMTKAVSDRFVKGDQLATKKPMDLGRIRLMLTINGDEFTANDGRYIPLVCESYNEENNYYTFSGYVSTDDEIGSNGTMHFVRGVYNMYGTEENAKEVTVTMSDVTMDLYSFVHYSDVNNPAGFGGYQYILGNYTFTNKYTMNPLTKFSFIKTIDYIRSSAVVSYDSKNPTNPNASGGVTTYLLKGSPMVKTQWVKTTENSKYLVNSVLSNYQFIDDVYDIMENNFSIDLKFYNTYGRSRFYRVGYGNDSTKMSILDRVNVSFNFGIKLDTLSSVDSFTSRFYAFVKDYIEAINNIESEGKPIYIMNMVSAIKANFDEILYLEYYGMNEYDYSVQRVESTFEDSIRSLGYNEYVPEFINIDTVSNSYQIIPAINITYLS